MPKINDVWQEIREPHTGDACFKLVHPTGLTIFVCPKEGYASSYAIFGTRYGSIDTAFYKDGEDKPTRVPAGIAHYLEHKLFENEDADAFERYAKTGASANAYTGFDRTAYLFTCTDRLEASLEILLDFVQSPYFTNETVAKEQGIIGQEIRMGEDSPSRQVLFNLLRALYHNHPVRIDIAGTVESIAEITPELLYGCYNTFYNLNNMALAVVGNVTTELVKKVADRILKQGEDKVVERAGVDEPPEVVKPHVVQKMPVSAPLFYLGFKDYFPDGKSSRTPQELIAAGVLLEVLAGRSSRLYNQLMERGLINSSFDCDYFDGPGYGIWLFDGESSHPDAVARAISDEIAHLRKDGIPSVDDQAAHKAMYGRQLSALNDIESVGDILISDFFAARTPFSAIDAAASLKPEMVERLLDSCLAEHQMALSIVSPI
ncbi:MAG: pitrilysin family protein [Oscillospiraceae bacterium]|nr:pitrilysin family protein [Oscillospiraceae bacterium]